MYIQFRMPVKTNTGKRWGKWETMFVNNRTELEQYRRSVMRGAQIKVNSPEPACKVANKVMQHICGV